MPAKARFRVKLEAATPHPYPEMEVEVDDGDRPGETVQDRALKAFCRANNISGSVHKRTITRLGSDAPPLVTGGPGYGGVGIPTVVRPLRG